MADQVNGIGIRPNSNLRPVETSGLMQFQPQLHSVTPFKFI